jgi:hypothetical protein
MVGPSTGSRKLVFTSSCFFGVMLGAFLSIIFFSINLPCYALSCKRRDVRTCLTGLARPGSGATRSDVLKAYYAVDVDVDVDVDESF